MKKLLYLLILLPILIITIWFFRQKPGYTFQEGVLPPDFQIYYRQESAEDTLAGVKPGNGVKFIRQDSGTTAIALLYIHGFSASRAEGEYVIDRLSDSLKANTYYVRLPGHGTNLEDHAKATFRDYLDEVEIALRMMHLKGDKVIVVGTSMGGLLATYLAAKHPGMVDGLILCSPFYDYANKMGNMLSFPGVIRLMELTDGPYRIPAKEPNWDSRKQPGYENFWYTKQRYRSLESLNDLKVFVQRNDLFTEVSCPVLLLYYYFDEEHQDRAASVEAMLQAFEKFSSSTKEKYAIEDGAHVLTSEYVRTDKKAVLTKMLNFTRQHF